MIKQVTQAFISVFLATSFSACGGGGASVNTSNSVVGNNPTENITSNTNQSLANTGVPASLPITVNNQTTATAPTTTTVSTTTPTSNNSNNSKTTTPNNVGKPNNPAPKPATPVGVVSSKSTPAQRQVARTYSYNGGNGTQTRQYLEYLPADYANSNQTYALLIFFHGSGEAANQSGNNINAVKKFGPPMHIQKGNDMCFDVNGQRECLIVLSPQSKDWSNNEEAIGLYRWALSHYRVDTSRIYVTGLSMGGGLSWTMASAIDNTTGMPIADKLATLVPVAGLASPNQLGCRIATAKLPVWAFHGKDDTVVSPNYSKRIVALLNGTPINGADPDCNPAANPAARLTLMGTNGQFVDHYLSWTQTYDPATQVEAGKNIYQWMLSQRR